MYGGKRYQIIDAEISLSGYFVIITSKKMTAADGLDLNKSLKVSEKLFREDKTFLGDRTMRCQNNEALHVKILIENEDLKSYNTKEAWQWQAENSVSMTRSNSLIS